MSQTGLFVIGALIFAALSLSILLALEAHQRAQAKRPGKKRNTKRNPPPKAEGYRGGDKRKGLKRGSR